MIVLGSDGAGTELKNHLIDFLKENNYDYLDCGEEKDYPDIAETVCKNRIGGSRKRCFGLRNGNRYFNFRQ